MLDALDADAVRRWAAACVDGLTADRAAIDEINVFPVPDGDTGTNLLNTMLAALDAVTRAQGDGGVAVSAVAAEFARGALRGARGNSGVIVSQALRGVAETLQDVAEVDGAVVCAALRRADELATSAVAEPVPGTMLSVLHAAAEAALAAPATSLHEVVAQAADAAAKALAETPRQLAVLAKAGVVDAGGRGLVVLLDALARVVDGAISASPSDTEGPLDAEDPLDTEDLSDAESLGGTGESAERHAESDRPAECDRPDGSRITEPEPEAYQYEVMYLLDGSDETRVRRLRGRLGRLGDCVSVVGDGLGGDSALWTVHVHCADVGMAIEVGIEAGRPHRIAVTRFADQQRVETERFVRDRAVVSVVRGAGTAELVKGEGATAALAPVHASDLLAAITGTRAAHVVLLPNDLALTPEAEQAAEQAVAGGQDVVVVPTASPVQGLAALAVHDAARRPGDDVVAMAEAAAATRRGELLVGQHEALTWVGRCQPGDLLGMLDGEVVHIEPSNGAGAAAGSDLVITAARALVDRLLALNGELVTALLGAAAPPKLAAELEDHMRREHPEVEFVAYQAAEPDTLLLLGVE